MSDGLQITPSPTDEEVAAITAALDAMTPRVVLVAEAEPPRSTAWKFSGRWWAKPLAARRDRPYR